MLDRLASAVREIEALRVGPDWSDDGEVRWSVRDGVGHLEVDRPAQRNAMSLHLMRELALAVEQLWRWEGSVAVLRASRPGVFCAGGDLYEVERGLASPAAGSAAGAAMTVVLDALWLAPQITVALVDGPAVGGGAELLTATDLRVFGPRGWVEFRQAALGVATGWGGAHRLASLVGSSRALRWLATGERLGPEQALRDGLADELSPEGAAAALTGAWMQRLTSADPGALRACKAQVLLGGRRWDQGEHEARAALFGATWGGPAHRERLAAARGRG
jgi:enoyl-CoA hydratase/carnithine racemase